MIKELILDGLNKKYTIDEDGNIFDIKENRYRKIRENEKGYLYCTFYINGKSKKFFIHRLVLYCFNPVPNMDTLQVNHIDGNKKNNNINNLEWCTQSENQRHAYRMGLNSNKGLRNPACKYSEKEIIGIADMLLDGKTIKEIITKYHVSKSLVSAIRNKRLWEDLLKDYDFPKSKYSNQK